MCTLAASLLVQENNAQREQFQRAEKSPVSIPRRCLGRISLATLVAYKVVKTISPKVRGYASSDIKGGENMVDCTCTFAASLFLQENNSPRDQIQMAENSPFPIPGKCLG